MAIIKFCNGHSKRGLKSLKNALNYIDDNKKTDANPHLVGGIAKNSKTAYERMCLIKKLWHKTDGRQYIHCVFAPKGYVKDDIMQAIAESIDEYFNNYSCFYAIHKNRPNTHAHFILNSVGLDGRKFNQSKSDMQKFKDFVQALCDKYQIEVQDIETIIDWNEYDDYFYDSEYDSEDDLFDSEYDSENDFSDSVHNREMIIDWNEYEDDLSDSGHNREMIIDWNEYENYLFDNGYNNENIRSDIKDNDENYLSDSIDDNYKSKNMIQVVNPDTDIVPMIYLIDDDGHLTPGI